MTEQSASPFRRFPQLISLVTMTLISIDVRSVEQQARRAEDIYICVYDLTRTNDVPRCITVAELSRLYSTQAVAIADELRSQAATAQGNLNSPQLDAASIANWLSGKTPIGCMATDNGGNAIAVLSRSAQTAAPTAGDLSAFQQHCKMQSSFAAGNALLDAVFHVFQVDYEADQFYGFYEQASANCSGASTASGARGPTPPVPTSGASTTSASEPNPKPSDPRSGGGGGGFRGYCVEPGACGPLSCKSDASKKALLDYMARLKYTGCNINAMPSANAPNDECAKARLGSKMTEAEVQKLLGHVCQARGSVAASTASKDQTFRCRDPRALKPNTSPLNTNVCNDPRAMCAERSRTPPRTGFKRPKIGPSALPFLPPGFAWDSNAGGALPR